MLSTVTELELNDSIEEMKGFVVRYFRYFDKDVNITYDISNYDLNLFREP